MKKGLKVIVGFFLFNDGVCECGHTLAATITCIQTLFNSVSRCIHCNSRYFGYCLISKSLQARGLFT